MDDDRFDELRRGLRGDGDAGDGGRTGVRARHAAVGAGVAVALALAVVVISAAQPADPPPPEATVLVDDAPTTSSTAAPVARVWPNEPVDVTGNEVRTGGHRWSVGRPGDVIALGDWDCDGSATPAVLRPGSGRLHLFTAWATEEAPLTASPGPTVPANASAVEPRGCGVATVGTADGGTFEIATTRR